MSDENEPIDGLMADLLDVLRKHDPDYKTTLFSLTSLLFLHITENTDNEDLQAASVSFLASQLERLAGTLSDNELTLQ